MPWRTPLSILDLATSMWSKGVPLGLFKQIKDLAAEPSEEGAEAAAPAQAPADEVTGASAGASAAAAEQAEPAPGGSPGAAAAGTAAVAAGVEDVVAKRRGLSRRRFLGGTAGLSGAALAAYVVSANPLHGTSKLPLASTLASRLQQIAEATGPHASSPHSVPNYWDFFIQVEREADLAVMDFVFYDFSVTTTDSGTSLTPNGDGAIVIVRFPPQSIGEGCYLYPDVQGPNNPTGLDFDPPPILSAVSGPSQLVFVFSADMSIPLPTMQAADLLDWDGWQLQVVPVAQLAPPTIGATGGSSYPIPTLPGPFDTYIELPYALYLSPVIWATPGILGRFDTEVTNRVQPLTSSKKVTDLFYTTMHQEPFITFDNGASSAVYPVDSSDEALLVAAIWCDDFPGRYQPTYNPNTDATPWTHIHYGEPIT